MAIFKPKWKQDCFYSIATQREAIPVALDGHDIIGLAETGSGKTGAFALPMLHDLIKNPSRLFGLVLTPTRELAYQIAEQIDKLGEELKVKTVTLVGEFSNLEVQSS